MQQQHAANHTLTLTATERLADHLRRGYNLQQSPHKNAWQSPQIISLSHWVKQQIALHLPNQHLLTTHQSRTLWQQIIQTDQQYSLPTPHLVQQAQSAWRLLQLWQLQFSDIKAYATTLNHHQFIRWVETYQRRCQQHNWQDELSAIPQLIDYLQHNHIYQGSAIYLAGFDNLPPLWSHLMTILKAQCTVAPLKLHKKSHDAQHIRCHDKTHEAEAMARWAACLISKHPKIRIGCIVPDLYNQVSTLQHAFTQHLPRPVGTAPLFNISENKQLSDYTLVSHVLLWLELLHNEPMAITTWERALLSPYAFPQHSNQAKSRLYLSIRERLGRQCSLRQLLAYCSQDTQTETQRVAALLESMQELLTLHTAQHLQSQSITQWSNYLYTLFSKLLPPQYLKLTQREAKLYERCLTLLTQLRTLNPLLSPITYKQAVQHLYDISAQTPYQPYSGEASITCLSPLESGGLHFDAVWIMGLSADAWPSAAKPHPLLPYELQCRYKMPHCTATHELAYCRHLTERFLQMAPQVIISSPSTLQQEPASPSPLIKDIPITTDNDIPLDNALSFTDKLRQRITLEPYDSQSILPTTDTTRCGTHLFASFSACPFQAFAYHRLNVEPLRYPTIGVAAHIKGLLLHHSLHIFWQQTQDHDTLCTLSEATLEQQLSACIETALKRMLTREPQLLKQIDQQLEHRRLLPLLMRWLAIEKQREPFSIHALEHKVELQLQPYHISMRIDRIDKLADGRYLIIDYKTGMVQIAGWFGELPDDPQLPLYCLSKQALPLAGVCFGQIQAQTQRFKGIIDPPTQLEGCNRPNKIMYLPEAEHWNDIVAHWKTTLPEISSGLATNYAPAHPKHGQLNCDRCQLYGLCRVHDLHAMAEPIDEATL